MRFAWSAATLERQRCAIRGVYEAQPGTATGLCPPTTKKPAPCLNDLCLQVMWTFGGTWLLVGTLVEVTFLFILDQI